MIFHCVDVGAVDPRLFAAARQCRVPTAFMTALLSTLSGNPRYLARALVPTGAVP